MVKIVELPADLLQIKIAKESARVFNERKRMCQRLLNDDLARRIFNDSLNDKEFKIAYELSNEHTSIDHLWNRHDVFHAVSSLLLGLKIVNVIKKANIVIL